jgi:hypothetical protein
MLRIVRDNLTVDANISKATQFSPVLITKNGDVIHYHPSSNNGSGGTIAIANTQWFHQFH